MTNEGKNYKIHSKIKNVFISWKNWPKLLKIAFLEWNVFINQESSNLLAQTIQTHCTEIGSHWQLKSWFWTPSNLKDFFQREKMILLVILILHIEIVENSSILHVDTSQTITMQIKDICILKSQKIVRYIKYISTYLVFVFIINDNWI